MPDPREGGAEIVIEDKVLMGPGVHIYVNDHIFTDKNIPIYDQDHTKPCKEDTVILRKDVSRRKIYDIERCRSWQECGDRSRFCSDKNEEHTLVAGVPQSVEKILVPMKD